MPKAIRIGGGPPRGPGGGPPGPVSPCGFHDLLSVPTDGQRKTKKAHSLRPKTLLSAVYEGSLVPFDYALKIQRCWFTNILWNPSSLCHDPVAVPETRKPLEKAQCGPKGVADQRVKKLGVFGRWHGWVRASTLVSVQAGIEVRVDRQTQRSTDKGKAYSASFLWIRARAQEIHRGKKNRRAWT